MKVVTPSTPTSSPLTLAHMSRHLSLFHSAYRVQPAPCAGFTSQQDTNTGGIGYTVDLLQARFLRMEENVRCSSQVTSGLVSMIHMSHRITQTSKPLTLDLAWHNFLAAHLGTAHQRYPLLCHIYLSVLNHGRNLEAGTESEAVGECCLLACSL